MEEGFEVKGIGTEPGAGAIVGSEAEAVVLEMRAEGGGREEREGVSGAVEEEVGVEAGGEWEDVDPAVGAFVVV